MNQKEIDLLGNALSGEAALRKEIADLTQERDEMRKFIQDVAEHDLQPHHKDGCMQELVAEAKRILASRQKEGKG